MKQLPELPVEIFVHHMSSFLRPSSLLHMSLTCKANYQLIQQEDPSRSIIWRNQFLYTYCNGARENGSVFESYDNTHLQVDWKQICRDHLYQWSDHTVRVKHDRRITISNNGTLVHYNEERGRFDSVKDWITMFTRNPMTSGNMYSWTITLLQYTPREQPVNYYTIIAGIVNEHSKLFSTCEFCVGCEGGDFGLRLGDGNTYTDSIHRPLIEPCFPNSLLPDSLGFKAGDQLGFQFQFNTNNNGHSTLTVYKNGNCLGTIIENEPLLANVKYYVACSLVNDQSVQISPGL